MHRTVAALVISLALAACAGGGATYAPPPEVGTGAESNAPPQVERTRPRNDRLTEEEVEAVRRSGRAGDAHVLIRQVRPRWLSADRGMETLGPVQPRHVQVWYNGRHLGPADAVLAGISISSIISIRYLDPITARGSYGADEGRGVILITGR